MKKNLLLLFLALFLTLSTLALCEEAAVEPPLPEPFIGSYTIDRAIRMDPWPNSEFVCTVPAESRLYLVPVNQDYAATSYEGNTGYIFYGDAALNEAAIEEVTPYFAVTTVTEYGYAQPVYSADITYAYPAKCALWVTQHTGGFALVEGDGESRFVPLKSLAPIKRDAAITAQQVYLNEADVLLLAPVQGASVLTVIPMGSQVTWFATNGNYAAILYEEQAGYVNKSKLVTGIKETKQISIGLISQNAVIYTAPNKYAYTDRFVPMGTLVCVDAVSGNYSHIAELDVYISTDCVQKVNQAPLTPFYGYWNEDQPLYSQTGAKNIPSDVMLGKHTPIEISINAPNGYYLIKADGQWGYIQKEGMKTLKKTTLKNAQATVAQKGTAVKQVPFEDSQTLLSLEEDTPIWLDKTFENYAAVTIGGVQGYIDTKSLKLIGENKPVQTYEAYIFRDTALLNFPDKALGSPLQPIQSNGLIKISVTNGGYGYISLDGTKGYIPLEDTQDMRRLFTGDDGRRYLIFVDKSQYQLSVYPANEAYEKTGDALLTSTIAIGKRTTPTPTGVFDLGGRERWHYFGPSFSPFAIQYAPGRYLHGPLYYSSNENAVNKARLKDFGTMATGGCLRMPYEDILWIYCHCNENNTKLEIVNGQ